ncbi:hypothetical protein EXS71_03870 [Candidatus Uhrbacteria bacterium]|nr:hypothetical protein [Candidatus Uhrbacteria bacterium]
MQTHEPTNGEILEALKEYSGTTNVRIDQTNVRIDQILEAISDFATHIESVMATKVDLERFATKKDLERFATKVDLERCATKADLDRFATKADIQRIVTKEYLDDKLADLRGDLILLARKQNRKFESFVEDLAQDGKISHTMADRILSMQPFPKLTPELLKQ